VKQSVRRGALGLTAVALLALGVPALTAQSADPATALSLTSTAHPPLPADLESVWISPSPSARASGSALTRGVAELTEGRADAALSLLSQPVADPELRGYQQYYRALALTRAGRADEARRAWDSLTSSAAVGALGDAIRLRAGEFAEASGDMAGAVVQYDALARGTTATADDLLLRLGRTRLAAGDRTGAVEAFTRLYEVYPLSELAPTAAAQLTDLDAWAPLERGSVRYGKELKRAERLFAARRYAQARDTYELLLPVSTSDDYELVSLRLAECDNYLKRYDAARTALLPWLDRASRRAEARFFHLTATRELGEHAEYVRLADALAAEFPSDSWSEETLNNLATHYILADDDANATLRSADWPASFPRAVTRRAQPGRSDGTRTGRGGMPSAPKFSRAQPAPFHGPTSAHRGSTGPPARATSWATRASPIASTASWSPTTGTRTTAASRSAPSPRARWSR
jgi:tetratricopeptide (TPR) repeat protein